MSPLLALLLLPALNPYALADDIAISGEFKATYNKVADPRQAEIQARLKDRHLLEAIAANYNRQLRMPSNVPISYAECGQPNAFYDPSAKAITICLEMIDAMWSVFRPGREKLVQEHEPTLFESFNKSVRSAQLAGGTAPSKGELEESWAEVEQAIAFILMHEIGHALVDQLTLPVTGREEDAVDQLATFELLRVDPQAARAAISGGEALLKISHGVLTAMFTNSATADQHALGPQRFYNILCWVYGADPTTYGYLVERGYLPKNRADRCGYEVRKVSRSWDVLLAPHRIASQ